MDHALIAFLLTLFAGLCTGIGSLLAFFSKKDNKFLLSFGLGFSAGVMIYISFMELLTQSKIMFMTHDHVKMSGWLTTAVFFGGILIAALIDRLIPVFENPHEIRDGRDLETIKAPSPKVADMVACDIPGQKNRKLARLGIFTAIAIAVHNFPEGFASFMASYTNLKLGIPIVIAIAIHNIPEGISVSVPIFCATGNKKKAFLYSFLSGLAEPLGAVLAYLILLPFLTHFVMGAIFGIVAGIMVYISFDELLPAAREYGEGHTEIWGLITGMVIMAASLNLL